MTGERVTRDEVISMLGEVFREHGYAGTTLSTITHYTGLGKSSLYHYFPEGKPEMAQAVLLHIDSWFKEHVFSMLRNADSGIVQINAMFRSVHKYFDSGRRICLVGAFALDSTRDHFAHEVNSYFTEWTDALAFALRRSGIKPGEAKLLAHEVIAGIQGALILARSRDDSRIFTRVLNRLRKRVQDSLVLGR